VPRNNVWIVTPPTAQAELADLEKQTTLMNQTLNDLKQQALLLSAPSGIAQVTPASVQVSAGKIIVTAGQNADISIVKSLVWR
jgi:type VI secretion system secreted protein VgrG